MSEREGGWCAKCQEKKQSDNGEWWVSGMAGDLSPELELGLKNST